MAVYRPLLGTLLTASLAACTHIGPNTIPRDRFDYGAAVGNSWKRETLLNIVKLRYADTPVFVEVAQIINQYSLEGQIDVSATFASPDTQRIGGLAKYADRPTITYTPLVGHRFTRSLLTPIPPVALVYLVRGGWSVDMIFRICLRSLNGLSNRSVSTFRPDTVPLFDEVVEILERIQQSGVVGMRIEEREGGAAAIMFLGAPEAQELFEDMRRLKELLGLDPTAREFELIFGSLAENPQQIAMLSRSLLEIMIEFAAEIDVSPEHLAENRVAPGAESRGDEEKVIRVRTGLEPSPEAFVQVRYRDHWFWIDDRDLLSKRSFLFLNILFSLVETEVTGGGAVLTVSAGG